MLFLREQNCNATEWATLSNDRTMEANNCIYVKESLTHIIEPFLRVLDESDTAIYVKDLWIQIEALSPYTPRTNDRHDIPLILRLVIHK